MDHYTSPSPKTFLTRTKPLLARKRSWARMERRSGRLILDNNSLKWWVYGKKRRELTFVNEEQKLRALEEYFGYQTESGREGWHHWSACRAHVPRHLTLSHGCPSRACCEVMM
ncbi:hypothetical protein K504DRAFT_459615 [Pleomassaria siparia CBS 279.74]|uniref:Uncharacterized protein n=1 Tax=Pleomassaria siparia CBS 279.74 TaxID=1314801 RepID=A0A6G1K1C3_9PLEO|nr:hypothetical protein K504DRAFT_459615 [Pleomassaria siparia CBS 279.74]